MNMLRVIDRPLRRVALWSSVLLALAACGPGNPPPDGGGDGNVLVRDNGPDVPAGTAGITVSPTSGLRTTEMGGTATFTVVLDAAPTADVAIALSSSNAREGTVAPAALTFTAMNWNAPQTVTVTGVDDTTADGDQAYTVVTAAAVSTDQRYMGLDADDVAVTNADNESAGITVTPTTGLRVSEFGTNAMFTIALNAPPTANVTIGLTSSNTMEATVFPASVVFTATNWNAPQTVRVTGVDDTVADGDQMVTVVTAAATSTDARYNGMNPPDVAVTNVDNDGPGITVLPTAGLRTSEAGAQATFAMVLNSAPTADVTIALTSSNVMEGTVAPATLRFTAMNWNAPQTVTVTGVDDMVADGNQMYTIRTAPAVSTDARYMGVDADDVAVTNVDNESAGVTVTPTSGLRTTEAGGTATFTVVLNSMPTNSVSVALSSSNAREGTVAPAALTFTAMNWNAPQTVTVTGVDDMVADGNQMFSIVTAPCASMDARYNGVNPDDVAVTNVDNDTPGITVRPTSGLTTSEAGGTATFTVVLNSQPAAGVSVALTSSRTTEGTVSPASLSFTSTNWNAPQTVTVRGVDDRVADGNQLYTVVTAGAMSTDTGYNGLNADDVVVVNTDNDSPGVTVTPTTGLTTNESGTTATFTVALNSQPGANVTMEVRSSNTREGTVAPALLTFTPMNFAAPQTVTVRGVDDTFADGNQRLTIQLIPTVSADPAYAGIDPPDVSVTNVDNDSAGITVAPPAGLRTSESGATARFTVVLNSQPTALVIIPLRSSNLNEGTVGLPSVTFTTTNWNAPQAVTVTGVEDDSTADGDQPYQVVLGAATSTDPSYGGLVGDAVDLVNTDNDSAGITVAPTAGLSTGENGATATFTVVLHSRPRADVTIALTSSNEFEGTASPSSLTFTALNWNAPQVVTVRGADDDVADGSQVFTIITAPAVSSDGMTGSYNNLDAPDVSVTNVDNDTPGITLTPTTGLHTAEPNVTAQFNVVLNSRPVADVVLTLTSSNTAEGRITTPMPATPTGSATLTIHPADWNANHFVVLTGVNDNVADGDQPYRVSTTATSTDPNYATLTVPDVSFTNDDNDTAGIRVVPGNTGTAGSELHTSEARTSRTFSVELTSAPVAGNVVVLALTSGDTTEGTVSPGTISFGSTDWNVPVTVTVTGVNDDVADNNQPYQVTVAVDTGAGRTTEPSYTRAPIAPAVVHLINDDNDSAGVVVSPTGALGSELLTSESGGTASFTVRLNSEPVGDVTVTLTSSRPSEGLVSTDAAPASTATLLFTAGPTGNWASPLTVTLTGQNDATPTADRDQPYHVTITTSSTDSNYNNRAVPDVNAINTDNDTPGVTFERPAGVTTYTTSESDGANGAAAGNWVRVRLATQPVSSVTVNLTTSDANELVLTRGTASADPAVTSVTFSSATNEWSTGIQVFLRGVNDSPAVTDGAASFTVSAAIAAGSDAAYTAPGVGLPTALSGVNSDNDSPGYTVTAVSNNFTTTENLGTATFNVRLNVQPSGTVTVALSSDNTGEGTVSPATLTFTVGTGTATDWNQDHLVTVAGVNDTVVDGPVSYNVLLSASGGGYGTAGTPFVRPVAMTNTDNDMAALVITPGSGVTTEASGAQHSATFNVQLAVQPGSNVSVTITGLDTAQGTLSTTSLSFTPGGGANAWNTNHPVTVTSVDDANFEGPVSYTLTLTASGGGYTGVTGTYGVNDVDNDGPPVINLAPVSGNFGAGGGAVTLQNASASISNPWAAAITQLAVTMTGGQPADVLAVSSLPATLQANVMNAGMSTVTLRITPVSGMSPSTADYEAALRALTFNNTDANVPSGSRSLAFSVTTATATTATPPTYALTVTALNRAPVNALNGSTASFFDPATVQGMPAVFSAASGSALTVSDPDSGANAVVVTLSAASGATIHVGTTGVAVSGNDTGTVSVTGTTTDVNAALNGATVTPSSGSFTGSIAFTISTNDQGNTGAGGALTDTDSFHVLVAPMGCAARSFNGHVYYYCSPGSVTWSAARGACHSFAGTPELTSIADPAENMFITNLASGAEVWIGLTDELGEGCFGWLDPGTPPPAPPPEGSGGEPRPGPPCPMPGMFASWNNGEPNNFFNAENWVSLLNNGLWNDHDQLTTLVGFVCEFPGY